MRPSSTRRAAEQPAEPRRPNGRAAGEIDRAVDLYVGLGDPLAAAEVLQRAGEEVLRRSSTSTTRPHEADRGRQAFRRRASWMRTKAKRPELALALFRDGWKTRPRLSGHSVRPGRWRRSTRRSRTRRASATWCATRRLRRATGPPMPRRGSSTRWSAMRIVRNCRRSRTRCTTAASCRWPRRWPTAPSRRPVLRGGLAVAESGGPRRPVRDGEPGAGCRSESAGRVGPAGPVGRSRGVPDAALGGPVPRLRQRRGRPHPDRDRQGARRFTWGEGGTVFGLAANFDEDMLIAATRSAERRPYFAMHATRSDGFLHAIALAEFAGGLPILLLRPIDNQPSRTFRLRLRRNRPALSQRQSDAAHDAQPTIRISARVRNGGTCGSCRMTAYRGSSSSRGRGCGG